MTGYRNMNSRLNRTRNRRFKLYKPTVFNTKKKRKREINTVTRNTLQRKITQSKSVTSKLRRVTAILFSTNPTSRPTFK